ncbi:Acetyltransferase [Lactococcus cremoris]|nr:Acetyltransferase [Lactococcus cremoris]
MKNIFGIFFDGKGLKKENSLNIIRLFLAILVVYEHTAPLGGYKVNLDLFGKSVGAWAVYIFFGISGYLITASAFSNSIPQYLIKRIARIFPAYLAIQFITAFIFAPLVTLLNGESLSKLWETPVTPLGYFLGNSLLAIKSWGIGKTLSTNPYPNAWNGSTWTIWNEFLCYIIIVIIVSLTVKYKKLYIPIMAILWLVLSYLSSNLSEVIKLSENRLIDVKLFVPLFAVFLAGSLLYTLRKYLKFNILGGIISLILASMIIRNFPNFGYQYAAPFILFVVFLIANKVPSPRWIKNNDLSYGVYLVAFPIQQLIAFALQKIGISFPFIIFAILASILSILAASLSWKYIELPSLNKVKGDNSAKQEKTADLLDLPREKENVIYRRRSRI